MKQISKHNRRARTNINNTAATTPRERINSAKKRDTNKARKKHNTNITSNYKKKTIIEKPKAENVTYNKTKQNKHNANHEQTKTKKIRRRQTTYKQ